MQANPLHCSSRSAVASTTIRRWVTSGERLTGDRRSVSSRCSSTQISAGAAKADSSAARPMAATSAGTRAASSRRGALASAAARSPAVGERTETSPASNGRRMSVSAGDGHKSTDSKYHFTNREAPRHKGVAPRCVLTRRSADQERWRTRHRWPPSSQRRCQRRASSSHWPSAERSRRILGGGQCACSGSQCAGGCQPQTRCAGVSGHLTRRSTCRPPVGTGCQGTRPRPPASRTRSRACEQPSAMGHFSDRSWRGSRRRSSPRPRRGEPGLASVA